LSPRFKAVMFAFLVILATYGTLYTIAAYHVASMWACRGSAGGWLCMGSIDNATFFPWPRGPLGVCAEVITKMKPVDKFIYLNLLKNGILIVICTLLWLLTLIYFLRYILPLLHKRKLETTLTGSKSINITTKTHTKQTKHTQNIFGAYLDPNRGARSTVRTHMQKQRT